MIDETNIIFDLKMEEEKLSKILDMLNSQGWQIFRRYLDELITRLSRKLETIEPDKIYEVAKIQGELRSYRTIINKTDYYINRLTQLKNNP